MIAPLTKRRAQAIVEALAARLAGPIDVAETSGIKHEDYEAALEWAQEQVRRRTKPKPNTTGTDGARQ